MAANKWSIANYNAFVREARAVYGLDQKGAQALYGYYKTALHRPAWAADVKRHRGIAEGPAGLRPKRAPRVNQRRPGRGLVFSSIGEMEAYVDQHTFEVEGDEDSIMRGSYGLD